MAKKAGMLKELVANQQLEVMQSMGNQTALSDIRRPQLANHNRGHHSTVNRQVATGNHVDMGTNCNTGVEPTQQAPSRTIRLLVIMANRAEMPTLSTSSS